MMETTLWMMVGLGTIGFVFGMAAGWLLWGDHLPAQSWADHVMRSDNNVWVGEQARNLFTGRIEPDPVRHLPICSADCTGH